MDHYPLSLSPTVSTRGYFTPHPLASKVESTEHKASDRSSRGGYRMPLSPIDSVFTQEERWIMASF